MESATSNGCYVNDLETGTQEVYAGVLVVLDLVFDLFPTTIRQVNNVKAHDLSVSVTESLNAKIGYPRETQVRLESWIGLRRPTMCGGISSLHNTLKMQFCWALGLLGLVVK